VGGLQLARSSQRGLTSPMPAVGLPRADTRALAASRNLMLRCQVGQVFDDGVVDLSCDVALEAADDFTFGLAFGGATLNVGEAVIHCGEARTRSEWVMCSTCRAFVRQDDSARTAGTWRTDPASQSCPMRTRRRSLLGSDERPLSCEDTAGQSLTWVYGRKRCLSRISALRSTSPFRAVSRRLVSDLCRIGRPGGEQLSSAGARPLRAQQRDLAPPASAPASSMRLGVARYVPKHIPAMWSKDRTTTSA